MAYDIELPEEQQQAQGFDIQLPEQNQVQAPTTLADVGWSPFKRAGEELVGGAKQVAGFQPAETGSFLDWLTRGPQGGPLEIPRNPVSDVLAATINKILGAGRVLGAGATAAGEFLGKGARYAGEKLGLPEQALQPAETTANLLGALFAPSGIVNAPITAATSLSKATLRPVQKTFATAEETSRANQLANLATKAEVSTSRLAKLDAFTNLTDKTAQLDAITARLAQKEGIQLTSPFGASLSAPVTDRQAYSFLEALKPTAIPNLKLTNLQKAAEKIISEFEVVPANIQPKAVKTAGKLLPDETAATYTFQGQPIDQATALELQKKSYGAFVETIKGHNEIGGLALDKLQPFKTSIGTLTQVTQSPGLGKRLYHGLMDDLREAAKTSPAAAQALRANEISAQNHAAREIADAVTFHGTTQDAMGFLHINPAQLRKNIQSNELLKGLPPGEVQKVEDTLNEVFRVNRQVEKAEAGLKRAKQTVKAAEAIPNLPEIITPQQAKRTPGMTMAKHAVGFSLGASAGYTMSGGNPVIAAAMGGVGSLATERVPQMIFQAALRPGGREFLRTLYADLPPVVGDAAKASALANFLASQGEY